MKHWEGYERARQKVLRQSLDADLKLIDSLFGRGGLKYGDTPEAVKAEALRQLEKEWRVPETPWGGVGHNVGDYPRGGDLYSEWKQGE